MDKKIDRSDSASSSDGKRRASKSLADSNTPLKSSDGRQRAGSSLDSAARLGSNPNITITSLFTHKRGTSPTPSPGRSLSSSPHTPEAPNQQKRRNHAYIFPYDNATKKKYLNEGVKLYGNHKQETSYHITEDGKYELLITAFSGKKSSKIEVYLADRTQGGIKKGGYSKIFFGWNLKTELPATFKIFEGECCNFAMDEIKILKHLDDCLGYVVMQKTELKKLEEEEPSRSEDNRILILLKPYASGEDLQELTHVLDPKIPMDQPEHFVERKYIAPFKKMHFVREFMRVLLKFHEKFIHRDLKPTNVIGDLGEPCGFIWTKRVNTEDMSFLRSTEVEPLKNLPHSCYLWDNSRFFYYNRFDETILQIKLTTEKLKLFYAYIIRFIGSKDVHALSMDHLGFIKLICDFEYDQEEVQVTLIDFDLATDNENDCNLQSRSLGWVPPEPMGLPKGSVHLKEGKDKIKTPYTKAAEWYIFSVNCASSFFSSHDYEKGITQLDRSIKDVTPEHIRKLMPDIFGLEAPRFKDPQTIEEILYKHFIFPWIKTMLVEFFENRRDEKYAHDKYDQLEQLCLDCKTLHNKYLLENYKLFVHHQEINEILGCDNYAFEKSEKIFFQKLETEIISFAKQFSEKMDYDATGPSMSVH